MNNEPEEVAVGLKPDEEKFSVGGGVAHLNGSPPEPDVLLHPALSPKSKTISAHDAHDGERTYLVSKGPGCFPGSTKSQ